MISFFTLTTNALKWQFPVEECIRSVLPYADEIVIVDGGSTDGTIEALEKISKKVRVINDETTKWEDNWIYWRMWLVSGSRTVRICWPLARKSFV